MPQFTVYPGEDFEVLSPTKGFNAPGTTLLKVDGATGGISSGKKQAITAAGAIDLNAEFVTLVGPAAGSYAVTLAEPTAAQHGRFKVIQMLSTTSTNAVTLALTNAIGGTAASSASFDAANETLVLQAISGKWLVVKQHGVTLS